MSAPAPALRGGAFAAAAMLTAFAASAAAAGDDAAAIGRGRLDWRGRSSSVQVLAAAGALRAYRFSATATGGAAVERTVHELADRPTLRSGNALFDGLFALALEEAAEASVESLTDGQFNGGQPVACRCFETGAEWHYLWTRDVAYAIDLGLGMLDPDRARNSLLFKQSGVRPELVAQGLRPRSLVVQDTGSGGSWPVSTDRVVWIHAASSVLAALPAAEATQLARVIYRVARDTLEQDRAEIFDARNGLYRGETSFLDWREQTYPPWTRADSRYIAESYSLSTNVLEYVALTDTALLAQRLGDERASRFAAWAIGLRAAINAKFWQEARGLYASVLGPAPGLQPLASHELLGLSLAIIHEVADAPRAQQLLASYPVAAAGPPVVWPEQPGIPIYHNRAQWPFVTAYALAAAKIARAPALASRHAEALLRGAALSLSNMENFELLTQAIHYDDGALSGPVINSRRQLWSVAGYLNMVVATLWGVQFAPEGVRFDPWLPGALAHSLFAARASLALRGLERAGASFNVTLQLPDSWSDDGWLEPATVAVNGVVLGDPGELVKSWPAGSVNEVEIALRAVEAEPRSVRLIAAADPEHPTAAERRQLYAPPAPSIARAQRTRARVRLEFAGLVPGEALAVYRDGGVRAADVRGRSYDDELAAGSGTVCYAATQRDPTGLESLPSAELCVAGPGTRWRAVAGRTLVSLDGHAPAESDGRARFADWGLPREVLEAQWTPRADGWYRLRLDYANASGPVNTGITAAVKRVVVSCERDLAQQGSLVMPQLPAGVYGLSTQLLLEAHAADRCRIRISDDFNMSYLEHFKRYSGGRGGRTGPLNQASIAAVELDWLGAAPP